MRAAARPTHSVSGPAPSASARQPVIPPMRAAKRSGSSGYWIRAPTSLLGLEMSRAPTASALISTFVRDIPHSLLILPHPPMTDQHPSLNPRTPFLPVRNLKHYRYY